jgi:hypothetical protein
MRYVKGGGCRSQHWRIHAEGAALGRKIAPQTDHKLINELSRLGGLQKHLFKEGNGVGSKEYAEILQAIKAAIFRIEQKND